MKNKRTYSTRQYNNISHRVKDATHFEEVENNFLGEKINVGKKYKDYLNVKQTRQ